MTKTFESNGNVYEFTAKLNTLHEFHSIEVRCAETSFYHELLCKNWEIKETIKEMEKIIVKHENGEIPKDVDPMNELLDAGFSQNKSEKLISFYVAQHLLILDFDEVCDSTYGLETKEIYHQVGAINSNLDTKSEFGNITAPTKNQAVNWLNKRIEYCNNILREIELSHISQNN